MLDIRAVAYISPVSEVDFASVALTVRIANVADETGLVTGKFRVYNDTTGLLIHTSDIAPLSMAAGAAVDVSALTDFDPPAPADDVYFVIFDATAVNQLVPNTIPISLGAFYFDVKPIGMGPAPAAHHATHEDGGSDEIDVTDLSGLLADPQTPLGHNTSHELGGSDELDIAGLQGAIPLSEVPQTLTDQAAIDWDLSLGGAATITLGGNRTLNAPTNMVDGAHYSLRIIQDGTGTRLITWNAAYRFPAGVDPCLSAAVNCIDLIEFRCDGTNMDAITMTNALA
jgi:hypothetical protein